MTTTDPIAAITSQLESVRAELDNAEELLLDLKRDYKVTPPDAGYSLARHALHLAANAIQVVAALVEECPSAESHLDALESCERLKKQHVSLVGQLACCGEPAPALDLQPLAEAMRKWEQLGDLGDVTRWSSLATLGDGMADAARQLLADAGRVVRMETEPEAPSSVLASLAKIKNHYDRWFKSCDCSCHCCGYFSSALDGIFSDLFDAGVQLETEDGHE